MKLCGNILTLQDNTWALVYLFIRSNWILQHKIAHVVFYPWKTLLPWILTSIESLQLQQLMTQWLSPQRAISQPTGFINQTNAHIFTFCSKTGQFSQQEALMANIWFTVISEVRKSKTSTFVFNAVNSQSKHNKAEQSNNSTQYTWL